MTPRSSAAFRLERHHGDVPGARGRRTIPPARQSFERSSSNLSSSGIPGYALAEMAYLLPDAVIRNLDASYPFRTRVRSLVPLLQTRDEVRVVRTASNQSV